MSVEDVVRAEEHSLLDNLKRAEQRSIQIGCWMFFVKPKEKQELITEQKKMKLDGWLGKPLHGQYPSIADEICVSCWRWLQTGYLKKERESLHTQCKIRH